MSGELCSGKVFFAKRCTSVLKKNSYIKNTQVKKKTKTKRKVERTQQMSVRMEVVGSTVLGLVVGNRTAFPPKCCQRDNTHTISMTSG